MRLGKVYVVDPFPRHLRLSSRALVFSRPLGHFGRHFPTSHEGLIPLFPLFPHSCTGSNLSAALLFHASLVINFHA